MKRITIFALMAVFCMNVADAAQTFIPGKLKEEYWQGSGAGPFKAAVEAGTAGTPTSISLLTSFEIPVNVADNYSARASGIHLLAGTQYYIEGVMNEFGGGDNMEVTFYNLVTESPPADGDAPRLTG